MITTKDLRAISRERLRDARALLRAKRFDGTYYVCGYAVELALKARCCRTLKWADFPGPPIASRAWPIRDLEALVVQVTQQVLLQRKFLSSETWIIQLAGQDACSTRGAGALLLPRARVRS